MKHPISKFAGLLMGMALVLIVSVYAQAQTFRHPGVINSRESLDFIKAKVAAGEQPWLGAYTELKNHSLASLSRSPNPRAIVECGAYSNPNNGCTEERDDAAAAYAQALLWYIEGNAARAQKAIDYMNAWSAVIQDHTEHNARLQTGWAGSNWTKAAEIIRYTGAGWTSTGISKFETMLKTVYYPEIQNGAGGGINGNWELTMIDAMIGIGVFCNDRVIFDKAVAMWRRRVPAYIYITSDGATPVQPPGSAQNINTYWKDPGMYVEGLGQETCRDLGHLTFGFSSMIYTAETALLQGIDLYNEQSRRIRAGLEYNSRLQEGWTGNGICGGSVTRNMSETLEIGYNHYVNRKGFSMPYTLAFLNRVRPTGRGHHIVWETMTHGQTGDAHGGPPACGVTASSNDGNVPQNTVDGDLLTRWSADGNGQWIQYCLANTVNVSGVQIAFYKGNERASNFDVLVSSDGTTFSNAALGLTSSGTSLAFEDFTFTPRAAKYVRIVGHGNNLNTWNSYTEVKILTGVNAAPSVSITAPVDNTVYTSPANVTINATATDSDGTITKVEFYNGTTKLGEDLTSPYSFTWSNVGAGSYSLTAKAFDNGGATKTSAAIAITVNTLPTIDITSPANGATFTAPATITLSATASDANGTIAKVEFYGNNTRLVEDFTAPYTFTWSNVEANGYTITAVATDNQGGQTVDAIDITVNTSCGGLPAPWQTGDIGAVGAPGVTDYCNGEFIVNGSGADIWGTADEFRYVYQPASGDVELITRVTSITNTNAWAKAGLMIRESLAAGSINAAVFVSAASGVTFQRRTATGGTTVSTVAAGIAAPVWLKLTRAGSNFTASRSADGITWTAIGTAAIAMTTGTQVGMGVTSHADGTVATGRFTNVSVTNTTPCAAPFASADDGNVAANVIDNDLLTRWSASGDPQWIQLCLPTLSSVSGVQIAFYKGNERSSRFDVLVSTDGTTFSSAATGLVSSGTSLALESFSFAPKNAKHVRIVGHGNNLNLWNSYTEVRINSGAALLSAETVSSAEGVLNIFPNPAKAKITITYHVLKAGHVNLAVYNAGNNTTISLVNEHRTEGVHQTIFDTKDLPAGVHVIKLIQNGKLTTHKMMKR